ncbi:MAG: endonuclease/exonuclease/phosphatase family protein [Pseudomonadota bacterium]
MSNMMAFTTGRDIILFGLCALTALFGALAIMAQLAAEKFFLLEMFVSLLPQVLVFGGLVTALCLFWRPRVAAGLAALTLITAFPFLFFSKYETPTASECGPDECFTILTINLWSESDYLPALSELIQEYEFDIVAVNEASEDTFDPRFENTFFPGFETVIHANWLTMPRGMGNPLSFFSRKPVYDFSRVLNRDTGRRAYITVDLAEEWDGVRIVMAHAMTPTSPRGLSQRNALIDDITEIAEESSSYIVLGDFNMTPWSPKFGSLPGKRAGDPRFTMTWPTIFPVLGMPIDHIMFSDDLELIEFEILRSIGSDHYPIMAKFKRKDR